MPSKSTYLSILDVTSKTCIQQHDANSTYSLWFCYKLGYTRVKITVSTFFWGEVTSEIARAGMFLAGSGENQQSFSCYPVSLFGWRFNSESKK